MAKEEARWWWRLWWRRWSVVIKDKYLVIQLLNNVTRDQTWQYSQYLTHWHSYTLPTLLHLQYCTSSFPIPIYSTLYSPTYVFPSPFSLFPRKPTSFLPTPFLPYLSISTLTVHGLSFLSPLFLLLTDDNQFINVVPQNNFYKETCFMSLLSISDLMTYHFNKRNKIV